MMIVVLLLFAVSVSSGSPLMNLDIETGLRAPESNYLLPEYIRPISYNVSIIPDFTTFKFKGRVEMLLNVTTLSNIVNMHAFDMTINLISVTSSSTSYPVRNFNLINTFGQQFLEIVLYSLINPVTPVKVTIDYTGNLNDQLQGFYRTKVIDNQGTESWMGVTQFEQTYARRAFPCFDEPSKKAVFTLQIASPPGYTATSNMPITSQSPVEGYPGYVWSVFETTPRMSTYLIAFAVHQFDSITSDTDNRFSVYAQPDFIEYGREALSVAPKVIDFMQDFTQHNYTLPKQDNIAVPELSFGAMENWGLVTYRENLVLYNEEIGRTADIEKVTTIVAHELAHQWFGNMVSPKWWNNTWLNEGFATYFEFHVSDQLEPTWSMEDIFIFDTMQVVLVTDSLNSTHPLLTEVGDGPSATAAFDQIAYNKGGCIVRMMVHLMGEKNFKLGINNYLTIKMFDNAEPNDLWQALSPFVPALLLPIGQTFSQVMDPWNSQPGYPYITITRDYNPGAGIASITQERFFLGEAPSKVDPIYWSIPLTFTSQDRPDFTDVSTKSWLNANDQETIVPIVASSDEWLIANVKQVGYYRVNYDTRNWFLIKYAMNQPTSLADIGIINRAQVMDDALNFARSKILSYTTALDMTSYLSLENEFLPWAAALNGLSYVQDRLSYDVADKQLFMEYLLTRISHMYDVVNGVFISATDSHTLRRTRVLLLGWICKSGHVECTADETRLFREWQAQQDPQNNNPIAPDLRASTYCTGMTSGGIYDYNFLLERYTYSVNTLLATERTNILNAIGCSHDPEILGNYLEESIKVSSKIRASDARAVLTAVYSNFLGVDLALDFLIANYERCSVVYGSETAVGKAFVSLAAKLNTKEQQDKLKQLQNSGSLSTALRPYVKDAVDAVELTLQWQTDNRAEVIAFLQQANLQAY